MAYDQSGFCGCGLFWGFAVLDLGKRRIDLEG